MGTPARKTDKNSAIDTGWGEVADEYEGAFIKNPQSYHATVILPNLLRIVDPKKDIRILEVGCGDGFFADAFAKGDGDSVSTMLAPAARADLSALLNSGEFDEEAAKIEAVRLVAVSESPGDSLPSSGAQVYWTIQSPEGAYVMGWNALRVDDAWVFDGTGSTATIRKRATEWDGASTDDLTKTTVMREASRPGQATASPAEVPGATALAAESSGTDSSEGDASLLQGRTEAATGVIPGRRPLELYLRIEIVRRAMIAGGQPMPADRALQMDLARLLSVDVDAIKNDLRIGEHDAKFGNVLPASEFSVIVDQLSNGLPSLPWGGAVTKDAVLGWCSEINNLPLPAIKALYAKGKK